MIRRHLLVLRRRLESLELAIRQRSWDDAEFAHDQVRRALDKADGAADAPALQRADELVQRMEDAARAHPRMTVTELLGVARAARREMDDVGCSSP